MLLFRSDIYHSVITWNGEEVGIGLYRAEVFDPGRVGTVGTRSDGERCQFKCAGIPALDGVRKLGFPCQRLGEACTLIFNPVDRAPQDARQDREGAFTLGGEYPQDPEAKQGALVEQLPAVPV